MNDVTNSLISADEVARRLACSAKHVRDLASRGMPHYRVGDLYRFDWAAVQQYLAKQTERAS